MHVYHNNKHVIYYYYKYEIKVPAHPEVFRVREPLRRGNVVVL